MTLKERTQSMIERAEEEAEQKKRRKERKKGLRVYMKRGEKGLRHRVNDDQSALLGGAAKKTEPEP